MYSSRGNSGYGQQSYAAQSAYGQPEADLAELAGYRGHPSAATHYGGQYSSVYGAATLGGAQQVASMSSKTPGSSALDGRSGYASAIADSPKFVSGDYVSSSSHGYGKKSDPLYPEKTSDYPSIDRRQYAERQSAYIGRDLPSEPTGRYTDSINYAHQLQPEIYDRIDQAALLRQEQLLKSQSQSLDGGSRTSDYLAARGASIRHPAQDLMAYGGRLDADPRNLSLLSGPAPSILGAAPRRNVDDLAFSQSSSNPGYGVSLPPGRDYATGKGIHGTSFESDYHSSLLSRGGRIDDLKDDRVGYVREIEMREEERRREKLREREKDREREKERERERERDRERQRERDRERERERERERILERRERERSRERKREVETRRGRTPPRISKDRLSLASTKDGRSLRRDSPRQESLHRRHSPIKEKRREYVCKVHSSSLVELERNYVSIDKRYPRLYIAPEFTKLVVNWPRENLKLSIHTPVSFEHDFVEEESVAEQKDSSVPVAVEQVKQEPGTIVRNAKMILMSGLSKNALEELSCEKSLDDRIPHFCNILRFAILKKDRSFMAIGGPWDSIDGGDPSVDDSCLVQTVLRHAKDVTQLDLQNCKNWNPFIEIHYDRVGKDGLFSHKEVTVFFLPDLSECLPELDTWRDQWLAHKKAVAERERQLSLKKEKSRETKEAVKDNGDKKSNDDKKGNDVKEVKGSAAKKKDGGDEKKVEKKVGGEKAEEAKHTENEEGKSTVAKTVKKKLVKKVVKPKASGKNGVENTENKEKDKLNDKGSGEKKATSGTTAQPAETSADAAGVKTFTRKKVAKKVPGGKSAQEDDKAKTPDVKIEKEDKPDLPDAAVGQETNAKTTVKKKVIKRVPKRKASGGEAKTATADTDDTAVAQAANETENKVTPKGKSKTGSSDKKEVKAEKLDNNEEKGSSGKKDSATKGAATEADKQKVTEKDNKDKGEKSKDDKEKKDKSGKEASKSKASAEMKEKKPEEPPRHPGLFLRTKRSKDSKMRSLSLSLDSLLDYTDKDTEESTFELSLFAETLHEMLQYQMGCRLLTFLQKLRIKFVKKRNQRKRVREETSEKENDKKSSSKRFKTDEPTHSKTDVKTDELTLETKSTKSEKPEAVDHDDKETKEVKEEDTTVDGVEKEKQDVDSDEEDPDEDPEEDEEMQDADPQNDSSNENEEERKKTEDVKPEEKTEKDKAETEQSAAKEKPNEENAEAKAKSDSKEPKEKETKVETAKKETEAAKEVPVDKELLEAFRFFDRNRVCYIRVDDMRLIIHTLGKFLSHRDVKELVQSALIESNLGRDDRILYNKLVRMSDL